MDDGLIRRLANICKDYYTLNTIDDLFVYAGADHLYRVDEPQTTIHSSQRIRRCYCWVEGIQKYSPSQRDNIMIKVLNQVISNPDVPEKERNAISDGLKDLDNRDSSQGIQIEPLLSTLARSLASAGLAREVAIITSAEPRLEWETHDNWGNVDICNLFLAIPYKLYDQIVTDVEKSQEVIREHIKPLLGSFQNEWIDKVFIVCQLLHDDKWRDKAIAWLSGQNVNNQGRVRSDNVAPRTADGLQFRSEAEINLYRAIKSLGISFAPLAVFVRGGQEYRRIEPDFLIINEGVVLVVEVDGDTFHRETPAEAYNRTTMLENEGARIIHVQAQECETPEKAAVFANKILHTITKLKEAGR